jgi:hypothetical protein
MEKKKTSFAKIQEQFLSVDSAGPAANALSSDDELDASHFDFDTHNPDVIVIAGSTTFLIDSGTTSATTSCKTTTTGLDTGTSATGADAASGAAGAGADSDSGADAACACN